MKPQIRNQGRGSKQSRGVVGVVAHQVGRGQVWHRQGGGGDVGVVVHGEHGEEGWRGRGGEGVVERRRLGLRGSEGRGVGGGEAEPGVGVHGDWLAASIRRVR